jgi:CoA:oxalate CoA-transferase
MTQTDATQPASLRTGPFAGIVIADLTHALSGPFCTMLLYELGARVVKVERPPAGDVARGWPPLANGDSVFFTAVNHGKESITLDVEAHPDRELLLELVRRADVVVENFRPGTLERHGIGYDALRLINPRIILASISGFGSSGPDSWEGAYDTVIQAVSGLMSVTGFPDGPPTMAGEAVADCLTGTFAFGAIGAALYARERTGSGAHIDIAMFDSVLSIMQSGMAIYLATGATPKRLGNNLSLCAPFGVFGTRAGDLAICAADDGMFAKLCTALGIPHLISDPRFLHTTERLANLGALRAALEAVLAGHTALEWVDKLQHSGVPCGVVRTIAQAAEDPQTAARNMIVRAGRTRVLGNPIKMSTLPDPPDRQGAPALDAQGADIRRELAARTGDRGGND